MADDALSIQEITIAGGDHHVAGTLARPKNSTALILFAHGSGSGRFSPRNQHVAAALQASGFATLLIDLLNTKETENRDCAFNIELLSNRVLLAINACLNLWTGPAPAIGLFGASTGAAAALRAAATNPNAVQAIVSRGGRPDLAWESLPSVHAPTRLIVGSLDTQVLLWNQQALQQLACPKDLVVVPNATHLFPEPGALEAVTHLAREWFTAHLINYHALI